MCVEVLVYNISVVFSRHSVISKHKYKILCFDPTQNSIQSIGQKYWIRLITIPHKKLSYRTVDCNGLQNPSM